ncbi:hypothetical protein [Chitinophaga caseinilytica]|uniref:NADPH-dependent FMN reductase n=1 Tax=Chitinophaga caseinilytica TaxID=2267521 RepID=A0ABZ2Z5E0_9BACT
MMKKTALHIISSARRSASFSKGLSSAIVDWLIGKQEIDTVIERDLTWEAPPYLNGTSSAHFTKIPAQPTRKNGGIAVLQNFCFLKC